MRGMSKKNLFVGTAFIGALATLGVAQSVMELRGRDTQLERALAETSEQRASLLDPVRDRL